MQDPVHGPVGDLRGKLVAEQVERREGEPVEVRAGRGVSCVSLLVGRFRTPPCGIDHTVPYGHARAGSRLLSPDDWARTALAAIARGGVGAVAVETVAAALGATKGSF